VFADFVEGMVEADGLQLFVRHAGTGPAVLLLLPRAPVGT
jgi:hypothetical protein